MKEEEQQKPTEVPHDYPSCLNHECPRAATCLRQIVVQEVDESSKFLIVINPKHLAALEGECPYYRSSAKVTFAKGFINMLDGMPHKQRQSAIRLLTDRFSQRTYYRIRKGERLLSPAEQQEVLAIMKSCGYNGTPIFDAYTEDFLW